MDKLLLAVLYLTFGLVIWASGVHWDTWQYWALIGLMVIIGHQERLQGRLETSTIMIIALKEMGVDVDRLVKVMTSDS
jgi:hypothetical protein